MAASFKSVFTAQQIEELLLKIYQGDGGVSTHEGTHPTEGVENHLYIVKLANNKSELWFYDGGWNKIETGGGSGPDEYLIEASFDSTTRKLVIVSNIDGKTTEVEIPEKVDIDEYLVNATYNDITRVLKITKSNGSVVTVQIPEPGGEGSTTYYPFYSEFAQVKAANGAGVDGFDYLAKYTGVDEDWAIDYFAQQNADEVANVGGCSGIMFNGYWGRNYDWNFDNQATVYIGVDRAPGRYAFFGTTGHSSLTREVAQRWIKQNVNNFTQEDYITSRKLPFFMQDGKNENGVKIQINVAPLKEDEVITYEPEGAIVSIPETMIPYYVLAHAYSAENAFEIIQSIGYYELPFLHNANEKVHFLIGDKETTFVVELTPEGPVRIEANKLTNFELENSYAGSRIATAIEGGKPTEVGVYKYGSGLERWNKLWDIEENYDIVSPDMLLMAMNDDLKFSLAYTVRGDEHRDEIFYTEFVGGDLTVDSAPEDYADILAASATAWENRNRNNSPLWVTTHTTVYDDEDNILRVIGQTEDGEATWSEAFNIEFNFGGSGGGTEKTTVLEEDLYAYAPIGMIKNASMTSPVKVAEAGDSLKDVFDSILGTQQDIEPTINTANTKVSTSQTGQNTGGTSVEVGTVVSSNGTYQITLSNSGTSNYGYRVGTTEYIGSQTFYYPIKKQSGADVKITLPTGKNITNIEVTTGEVVISGGNTVYCNFANKILKFNVILEDGEVGTTDVTRFGAISYEIQFDKARKIENDTTSELTAFLTYLKNDATNQSALTHTNLTGSSSAWKILKGSYFPYYNQARISPIEHITSMTKSTDKLCYEDGVDMVMQADGYIFFYTPEAVVKNTIQQYAMGSWNNMDTSSLGKMTITLASGGVGVYNQYRTTKEQSKDSSLKVRVVMEDK